MKNLSQIFTLKLLRSPLLLLLSIFLGGITGYCFPHLSDNLKPLGDIFLNLLFTLLPLLVFFSIASALSGLHQSQQLGKLLGRMMLVFMVTSLIAAIVMLSVVIVYPITATLQLPTNILHATVPVSVGDTLVHVLTVSNLADLFSTEHILALICFSSLIGLATHLLGNKAKVFADFLEAGKNVSLTAMGFITYYAPIGFFAFFANTASHFGTQLYLSYGRAMIAYYGVGTVYFLAGYSLYVAYARGWQAVIPFWRDTLATSLTALSTCSSAASLPVNLEAAQKLKIDSVISTTVIPLGTMIHKEGSILGGIVKIAFLYSLFHLSLFTFKAMISATLVAILVGTVMGGIPSGGLLGELLILSVYGFPPQTLMLIATISLLIDPMATLLNVVGNTVSSVLVEKLFKFKAEPAHEHQPKFTFAAV